MSGDPREAALLDELLGDANDYGVIFVEPIAHAYARVKEVDPSMVIVFCEIDDPAACRLLSMFKVDAALSKMVVLTCASRRAFRPCHELVVDALCDAACAPQTVPMH
jgi:hypothetical protein